MKKALPALSLASILAAILLLSCGSSRENPGDSPGDIHADSSTELRFALPAPAPMRLALNASGAESLAIGGDYQLMYQRVSNGSAQPNIVGLSSGANSISLDKDGVYVLGLYRKSSGTIQRLGPINVASLDLGSLPLSVSASDVLDLGELDIGSGSVDSSMSSAEASEDMGYPESTLREFGSYNGVFGKFLNPDINENGEFDAEESLTWTFGALIYFNFRPSDFDFEQGSVNSSYSFSPTDFQFVFRTNKPTGYPSRSEDISVYADILMSLSGVSPRTFTSKWVNVDQVYFRESNGQYSDMPADGDYLISLPKAPAEMRRISIDGAAFTRATNGYADFPFPVARIHVNSSGRTTSVDWKWLIRNGDGYRVATEDEVKLRTLRMHFSWERKNSPGVPITAVPSSFGLPYWKAGSMDLSSSAYDGLITSEIQCLFIDFVDIAGNYYKFNFYNGSGPYGS
jgi:hypothetical protein